MDSGLRAVVAMRWAGAEGEEMKYCLCSAVSKKWSLVEEGRRGRWRGRGRGRSETRRGGKAQRRQAPINSPPVISTRPVTAPAVTHPVTTRAAAALFSRATTYPGRFPSATAYVSPLRRLCILNKIQIRYHVLKQYGWDNST